MVLPKLSSLSIGNLFKSKFVLAGAVVAASTVIGGAGIAAAHSWDGGWGHHNHDNPAIVRFCKHHYQDLGFKNIGQCVSSFHHNHGHGYGYGHHDHHGDGDNDQDDQGEI